VAALPRLLRRFQKLAAPPGRPAAALGVPASGQDAETELAPLLDALDAVEREAAEVHARAREDADRRREQARREAAAIAARARDTADAERARAAAAGRSEADAQAAEAQEAAAREVARIQDRRDERLDALVAEVIACVRRSGR
jgi:hypothetical protein